ncbi:PEP-CTERM sorting domain-containing protein [Coleofasciculus sp. FACHB-SPT9]|uniref:PEP-CTERM sorting domain-containing protein n=1 Tax=Cyanophyceae TaxID=3028117 RepID=UPI0018EF9DEC|nr:PEP-CTERM sorting domain-containing protein [Coleofasciculus sp. FACHB-SPT9]
MATFRKTLSALVFSTVCFSLSALIAPKSVQAATLTTLTFDELPTQPADDLSFKGVTFDFKVNGENSTAATYNVERKLNLGGLFGVEEAFYFLDLSPPVLEIGAPGILTLDFAMSTSNIMFDVAKLGDFRFQPLPKLTVQLFDEDFTSLGITEVILDKTFVDDFPSPLRISVSGTTFTYSGTPVKRAVVDFTNELGSWGFDNLSYLTADRTASVPEPASVLGLLALGAFGATSRLKRKQKK